MTSKVFGMGVITRMTSEAIGCRENMECLGRSMGSNEREKTDEEKAGE